MARDKKKQDEAMGGAPAWMVTYGDLMSLLLTFFVLLLSFSTITEEEAFKEAIASFRGAVGFLPKELTFVQINPLPKPMKRPSKAAEDLARKLRRRLQVLGKDANINVEYDAQGGLKISLPSKVLFDTAKAEMKPEAHAVLGDIAEILAELPSAFFEVRGHTDSRPMTRSATYRDNYDLSFGRADAVARHVSASGNIPMNQFEIIACGPGQPIAPNDTLEGQQVNRRVEINVRGLIGKDKTEELKTRIEALTNTL